jgi:hypothetical protein
VKQARYQPRDHLGALVSGSPDKKRRNRLLLMLQAHIDDSGWDGVSPVFVLAGYVAKKEQWDSFSDQWRATLDLDPLLRPSFKMKRCLSAPIARKSVLWMVRKTAR